MIYISMILNALFLVIIYYQARRLLVLHRERKDAAKPKQEQKTPITCRSSEPAKETIAGLISQGYPKKHAEEMVTRAFNSDPLRVWDFESLFRESLKKPN